MEPIISNPGETWGKVKTCSRTLIWVVFRELTEKRMVLVCFLFRMSLLAVPKGPIDRSRTCKFGSVNLRGSRKSDTDSSRFRDQRDGWRRAPNNSCWSGCSRDKYVVYSRSSFGLKLLCSFHQSPTKQSLHKSHITIRYRPLYRLLRNTITQQNVSTSSSRPSSSPSRQQSHSKRQRVVAR